MSPPSGKDCASGSSCLAAVGEVAANGVSDTQTHETLEPSDKRLTILVDHLFAEAFPLAFGQDFDNDKIARDGSVHRLEAGEKDRLRQRRRVDGCLWRISLASASKEQQYTRESGGEDGKMAYLAEVVLARVEVALNVLARLDSRLEYTLRQMLGIQRRALALP